MNDRRLELVRARIRDVPDFPKPGIIFKDITPLLGDPEAFGICLELLAERYERTSIDAIVGIESRGFIFGAALAARMQKPFVPARKPGKLPSSAYRVEYELEYGTDAVEMHTDAFDPGSRVLVLDDLLATGGTARATAELVQKLKGQVAGLAFVIELTFLNGAQKLGELQPFSLVKF